GFVTAAGRRGLEVGDGKHGRPSYRGMKYLLEQGYHVSAVAPKVAGKTVLGQQGDATLADIPEKVDRVDVFRNSDAAWGVAQEAIAIGPTTLWLQLGVIHQHAEVLARDPSLLGALRPFLALALPLPDVGTHQAQL
ncbi:CoA-binding protein, partial [Salmonella enterica]|uniref:CoA-binding protein n=1 Tax=Salmonella enterica TaxID=28901 RepID=UPI00398C750C